MRLPFPWLALGFLVGLFASATRGVSALEVVLLLAASGAAYLLAREHRVNLLLPCLLAVGVAFGFLRGGPDVLEPSSNLERFHGTRVSMRGIVRSLPEPASASTRLRVEFVATEGHSSEPVKGQAIVWVQTVAEPLRGRIYPFLEYGDEITVAGVLEAPVSDSVFDYREHLASQGIGSIMYWGVVTRVVPDDGLSPLAAMHRWRARMASAVTKVLPEPQASLTLALVLGIRGGIDPGVVEQFRRAGLAHLLAVSGMHVGILLGIALAVSVALFGRHRRVFILGPLAVLWAYVFIAGAPPSAVRASMMGSVYLLALVTGRQGAPLNALAVSALILTALDPPMLWNRSFQLSFSAMAGVLVIGLPLWHRVHAAGPLAQGRHGLRGALRGWFSSVLGAMGVSLGAVLGSLPLVALNFGEVPTLGMVATLVVMPALPPLLVGGGLTAALGAIWAPLGWVAGWVPTILGAYLQAVAAAFSSVPGAVWPVNWVSPQMAWAYYVLAALLMLAGAWRAWLPGLRSAGLAVAMGPQTLAGSTAILGVAAVGALLPWGLASARTDGNLHVYFLDVGQGDAILFRTPSGMDVLVDGGPDPRVSLARIDRHLPLFDRSLELVFLTHSDADHLNGVMALARRGRIQQLFTPPPPEGERGGWRRELEQAGLAPRPISRGAVIRTADGVIFEVLHPPDPLLRGTGANGNNNGIVLRVTYGESVMLLPADVERPGELALLDASLLGTVDVLKLGHHGSGTSSTAEFLGVLRPSIGVISAGQDNRFGHPSPEALERVSVYIPEDRLFSTLSDGTVELTTDGERWWAKGHR